MPNNRREKASSPDQNDKQSLRALQVELVKLQNEMIRSNAKILVLLEGRDTAGKDGRVARLNAIKNMLSRLDYKDKDESLVCPDPNVVFPFEQVCLTNGMISP